MPDSGTAEQKTSGQNGLTLHENDKLLPETIGQMMDFYASDPNFKDRPAISYSWGGGEYVDYTPSQLNLFAERAAAFYSGLVPRRLSSDDPVLVLALLGSSTLEYFITQLGLSKLGHTALLLSPRISLEAHISLLDRCKATGILIGHGHQAMGEKILQARPHLKTEAIITKETFGDASIAGLHPVDLDLRRESRNIAWIIHSSGSTSLPKPIFISHAAAIANYQSQIHLSSLITTPIFHANGLNTVFRSLRNHKQAYLYNGSLPLTARYITTTLEQHPSIRCLYAVPYALKLLAENARDIELLARLDAVVFGGATCPKPIGDRLAAAGVMLIAVLGTTEAGQTMTSFRPRAELAEWDWLRPMPAFAPYVRWEPVASTAAATAAAPPGLFEMVVLPGWGAKAASNRDDGAWASNDLFERHAAWPRKDAWRYYARKDDTLVLVNGEKANPLLLEGVAQESALVREAVAFGAQRDCVGLFVVPTAPEVSREEVVEAIWPGVEKANLVLPGHAKLSKDMVRILPSEYVAKIRKTDKGNIIRPAFYRDLVELIDGVYEERVEKGHLVLDRGELRKFLRDLIERSVRDSGKDFLHDDTDLFSLGIDSLRASRLRAGILRDIDIGSNKIGLNFVFDFPSINAMAEELYRLRTGGKISTQRTDQERMKAMIDKYSDIKAVKRAHDQVHPVTKQTVLVTGVTGSLGAHIVAALVKRADVSKIICLVRAPNDLDAQSRAQDSLKERRLGLDIGQCGGTVEVFATDNLAKAHLGLASEITYNRIKEETTSIIHCAWSVNFNMGLESFEKDCIGGLAALLSLHVNSSSPASFTFCSSVSAANNMLGRTVPEILPESLTYAQSMGYAQSKLVAEHICMNAAASTGSNIKILRIGQIVGDTENGIWNPNEAIPMIFRSASTVGVIPSLSEECSWLPVDEVAASTIELTLSKSAPTGVYHVVNHQTFNWSKDVLPLLSTAGLSFKLVERHEWLKCLEAKQDPEKNPPYRLIEFFKRKYGGDGPTETKTFLSDKARAISPTLQGASTPNQALMNKVVHYLQHKWAAEDGTTSS